jgi:hypothetical protein
LQSNFRGESSPRAYSKNNHVEFSSTKPDIIEFVSPITHRKNNFPKPDTAVGTKGTPKADSFFSPNMQTPYKERFKSIKSNFEKLTNTPPRAQQQKPNRSNGISNADEELFNIPF